MTEIQSVSDALMPLIPSRQVSNATRAMIGEIITLDALFADQPLRGTLEQIGERLEGYEAILQRTITAVAEFSQNRDREGLRKSLSEIKEKLAALDQNSARMQGAPS